MLFKIRSVNELLRNSRHLGGEEKKVCYIFKKKQPELNDLTQIGLLK